MDQEVSSFFGVPSLDILFQKADTDHDGMINPQEAKVFFPSFGLPFPFLKTLWTQCVTNPTAGMSRSDFDKAMRMAYSQLKQQQPAPAQIPQQSAQSMSTMQQNPQMGASMMNKSPVVAPVSTAGPLSMTSQQFEKYFSFYDKMAKGAPAVPLMLANSFYVLSKLPQEDIQSVWKVINPTNNQNIDLYTFVVGMHLISIKTKTPNFQFPSSIPQDLSYENFQKVRMQSPQSANPMPTSSVFIGSVPQSSPAASMATNQPISSSSINRMPPSLGPLANQADQLRSTVSTMRTNLTEEQMSMQQAVKKEAELKKEIEELTVKRAQLDKEKTETSLVLAKTAPVVEQLKRERLALQSQVEILESEAKDVGSIREEGTESMKGLQRAIEELKDRLQVQVKRLKTVRDNLVTEHQSSSTLLKEKKDLQNQCEISQQQLLDAEMELFGFEKENRITRFELEKIKIAQEAYEQEGSSLKAKKEKLMKEKRDMDKQLQTEKETLDKLIKTQQISADQVVFQTFILEHVAKLLKRFEDPSAPSIPLSSFGEDDENDDFGNGNNQRFEDDSDDFGPQQSNNSPKNDNIPNLPMKSQSSPSGANQNSNNNNNNIMFDDDDFSSFSSRPPQQPQQASPSSNTSSEKPQQQQPQQPQGFNFDDDWLPAPKQNSNNSSEEKTQENSSASQAQKNILFEF